jgi:hypothetical protein
MNLILLRKYISEYEKKFVEIHDREIYKWRAVKHFQDHWDSDAGHFDEMLANSLQDTGNLLTSANYWPKKMILQFAEKQPKAVRDAFELLFDEEADLLDRIEYFQSEIHGLKNSLFPGMNDYQDKRAVLVYLSLRYPDVYFFYKFGIFKDFCERVEHDYIPKGGKRENVIQYLEACKLVREEILANRNLLILHLNRLTNKEYPDSECNILTQDFIYAVSNYLSLGEKSPTLTSRAKSALHLQEFPLVPATKEYHFKGTYIDHLSNQRRNKYIGDLGEQIVLEHEKQHCPERFKSKVVSVSKTEGDGLGYDILSFDEHGKEKYIEVKATTAGRNKPFFITGAELECSKRHSEHYFLYRLYNLNKKMMTADFHIIQGDLSKYCNNPIQFEVIPDKSID